MLLGFAGFRFLGMCFGLAGDFGFCWAVVLPGILVCEVWVYVGFRVFRMGWTLAAVELWVWGLFDVVGLFRGVLGVLFGF